MDRDDHPSAVAPTLISSLEVSPESPASSLRKQRSKKNTAHGQNGHTPAGVKTFVLDTNVLLHDPACVERFAEHHVCIPVDVLSELDRFKNEMTERGANAREVHRSLMKLFSEAGSSVTEGAATAGGSTVLVVNYAPDRAA